MAHNLLAMASNLLAMPSFQRNHLSFQKSSLLHHPSPLVRTSSLKTLVKHDRERFSAASSKSEIFKGKYEFDPEKDVSNLFIFFFLVSHLARLHTHGSRSTPQQVASGAQTPAYKKLLGAPGLTTRSKDATRGSWHRY